MELSADLVLACKKRHSRARSFRGENQRGDDRAARVEIPQFIGLVRDIADPSEEPEPRPFTPELELPGRRRSDAGHRGLSRLRRASASTIFVPRRDVILGLGLRVFSYALNLREPFPARLPGLEVLALDVLVELHLAELLFGELLDHDGGNARPAEAAAGFETTLSGDQLIGRETLRPGGIWQSNEKSLSLLP